jgi:hypothetical protein
MESRLRFWDSMRPWFLARGYTLYQYNYKHRDELEDYVVTTYPAVPAEGETHWPYPYAVQATDSPTSPVPPSSRLPLVFFFSSGFIAFDSHVLVRAKWLLPKTPKIAMSPLSRLQRIHPSTGYRGSSVRMQKYLLDSTASWPLSTFYNLISIGLL